MIDRGKAGTSMPPDRSDTLTGGSKAMKAMQLVLFLLTIVTPLGLGPAAQADKYELGQLLV